MKNRRPPESEARMVIVGMMIITFILAVGVAATSAISTNMKSIILIGWIAVMIAVLRRYRA